MDDVLRIVNSECTECYDFFGRGERKYDTIEIQGDDVTFRCGYGMHEHKALKRFTPTRDDLKPVEAKFKKVIEDRNRDLKRQTKLEDFQKKSYLERTEALIRLGRVYAKFFSKDAELQFDGICVCCGKEVPLSIRENRLWTSCSPCASIIADSLD